MKSWHCGRFRLELGRKTHVMGILNATPDSFSGDGVLADQAIAHALELIEAGADILDIGGESTRPGSEPVSLEEELERVVPLTRALASRVEIPLSIDTTKAEVARQAIAAGASIINDISGATFIVSETPNILYRTPLLHRPLVGHLSFGKPVGEQIHLCLAYDVALVSDVIAESFLADVADGLEVARFLFA
ncbi:hypothetical protein EON80_02960 [bacterium]|nr:MAG: hypothetical protein EON80_02960 [bacterium]